MYVELVTSDHQSITLFENLITQWAKSPKKQSVGVYFWPTGKDLKCRGNFV